jgi:hypothetical protein
VPGGIRTPNLLIRSQLLYPVELQTPRCATTDKITKSTEHASLGLADCDGLSGTSFSLFGVFGQIFLSDGGESGYASLEKGTL